MQYSFASGVFGNQYCVFAFHCMICIPWPKRSEGSDLVTFDDFQLCRLLRLCVKVSSKPARGHADFWISLATHPKPILSLGHRFDADEKRFAFDGWRGRESEQTDVLAHLSLGSGRADVQRAGKPYEGANVRRSEHQHDVEQCSFPSAGKNAYQSGPGPVAP